VLAIDELLNEVGRGTAASLREKGIELSAEKIAAMESGEFQESSV